MTEIQNLFDQAQLGFEHLKIRILKIVSSFEFRVSNFTFYLLILLFPTQFGRHFFTDFSFVSGFRVDYLSPTLYLTDILIFSLFLFWLFSLRRHSGNSGPVQRRLESLRNLQDKGDFGQARLAGASAKRARMTGGVGWPINLKFQIGLFAGIVLIGIVFSKSPHAGIYGLVKLIEFVFLGFYTAFNIKKLKFDLFLVLLSIGVIFESFLAILQFVNQNSISGVFYFFGERTFSGQTPGIANASINGELVLRPYGTFSHPNVLAGYLVIVMTIVSSKFPAKRDLYDKVQYFDRLRIGPERTRMGQSPKLIKAVIAFSLIMGTMALFLTMSRAAIVLWVFIVIITLLHVKKFPSSRHSGNSGPVQKHPGSLHNLQAKGDSGQARLAGASAKRARMTVKEGYPVSFKFPHKAGSRFARQIGLLAFIVSIGIILFLSPLGFRFTDIKPTDESVVIRQELMKSTFLMIKDHLFFGVGLNNFLTELPKYKKINNYFLDLQPVHNIYLLVAAQTGIVGLAFFAWFIGKTYYKFKVQSSKFKVGREDGLALGHLPAILLSAILVLGLLDHYFLTLQQGQLLFSFVLGLCWADWKN